MANNIKENSTIAKAIETIREYIKNTTWDDKVFIIGPVIRKTLVGDTYDDDIEIYVNVMGNSGIFANFLANANKSPTPVVHNAQFSRVVLENIDGENSKLGFKIMNNPRECYITVDSMEYNVSSDTLRDFNNGVSDIESQTIRACRIGDIAKKPSFILNAISLSCETGWGISKDTWFPMIHNAKKLETVDKHALKDDIDAIMFSEIPSIGIKRLIRCNDALKYIFPHLFELSINAKSLFEESLVALDLSENKIEDKFAALFMNVSYHNGYDKNAIKSTKILQSANIADKTLDEFGYPESIRNKVKKLIESQVFFLSYTNGVLPSNKNLRKLQYKSGEDLDDILDVAHTINISKKYGKRAAQIPNIRRKIKELDIKDGAHFTAKTLPINGADIMEMFNLKPSPLIGELISKLKKTYEKNPHLTEIECYDIVKNELAF